MISATFVSGVSQVLKEVALFGGCGVRDFWRMVVAAREGCGEWEMAPQMAS